MRPAGRITASIDVLQTIEQRGKPAKVALKEWASGARYAGAKDRAWISGLVLDTLRKQRSLAWTIGLDSPRARVLAALKFAWGWDADEINDAVSETPHGSGPLKPDEWRGLADPRPLEAAPAPVAGDYPDWLDPNFARAWGEDRIAEARALAGRAPVDLRVNTLKATPEKALKALVAAGLPAAPAGLVSTAIRLPAVDPGARGDSVDVIPAYSKGWVEVQDLGSQLAAAAAGDVAGAQVLDFCAGGGGKTLALAALMGNTGQIYAYDNDPRRLSATVARASRAGVRNLQLRTPHDANPLHDLVGKMDVVFVDAPCTGSGVWRRQPDAKWRLRPGQLDKRLEEQDTVLGEAARFVKPGGRLVFVTCSTLCEENEDRLANLLAADPGWTPAPATAGVAASGLVAPEAAPTLAGWEADGRLRLTPLRADTDGFFVSVLERR